MTAQPDDYRPPDLETLANRIIQRADRGHHAAELAELEGLSGEDRAEVAKLLGYGSALKASAQ
jgi:hypothetical protein